MRNPLTLEAFADWCEAQGDRTYHWESECNCAAAQYARHLGLYDDFSKRGMEDFWRRADIAALRAEQAGSGATTFPALATRLRTGEA